MAGERPVEGPLSRRDCLMEEMLCRKEDMGELTSRRPVAMQRAGHNHARTFVRKRERDVRKRPCARMLLVLP